MFFVFTVFTFKSYFQSKEFDQFGYIYIRKLSSIVLVIFCCWFCLCLWIGGCSGFKNEKEKEKFCASFS